MNWRVENGIGGVTATGIRWRQPDTARVEAWRLVALREAESAVRALKDAGHSARVYRSVLRSAYQPFGFHPHSDVDLVATYASNRVDPISDQADILAIAESEVRSARLSCLLVPKSQPDFVRPFDPAEILRRSLKRLEERRGFLQRLVARHETGRTPSNATVYQEAAGYQLGEIQKAADRILKLVVHGHLGWLPETEGSFTRRGYRDVLIELAAGASGTNPLICARELAFVRSDCLGATPTNVGPASGDISASVTDLLPVLRRLVDAFVERAEGPAGSWVRVTL